MQELQSEYIYQPPHPKLRLNVGNWSSAYQNVLSLIFLQTINILMYKKALKQR